MESVKHRCHVAPHGLLVYEESDLLGSELVFYARTLGPDFTLDDAFAEASAELGVEL
jgi:hypothetical protein